MPFLYIGIGIAIFLINCVLIYYLLIKNKTKKEAKHNEVEKKKEEIDELDASYIEYKYCRKEKLFKEPKDEE